MGIKSILFIVFGIFTSSTTHAAIIYNAANDFSLSNPNGEWSYGYSTSLGGVFNAYAVSSTSMDGVEGIQVHSLPLASGQPSVFKNITASTLFPFATITLNPGQLALHPGPNGEVSIVRWTAPTSNTVSFAGSYEGIGGPNTSTDVHVLLNGSSIFDGLINSNSTAGFSNNLFLNVGDTLDFAVGFGGNGFGFDSTALDLQISTSAVPVPAAAWLFGSGLIGLIGIARRKKA